MSDLRTAAQQALEFLDAEFGWSPGEAPRIDALRAALAQQAEPVEPVAWYQKRGQEVLTSHPACWGREDEPWTPLYTAPPQRKPLTEEEIVDAVREADLDWQKGWTLDETQSNRFVTLARAVERAHGIKE